ncbi:hypothetical protein HHX47_DHR2000336 [Lentinula edodes]|nr:hypothetical protein HHX47_DHR2000336 [Lentinula edodes]
MAKMDGSYKMWMGSPTQQGQLQFNLWSVRPTNLWDCNILKENISKYGMRNLLLTAAISTASTSQMPSCNKCFDPYMRTKPAAQAIQFTDNAAVFKNAKMHQAKAAAEKKVNLIPLKPIVVALTATEHNFVSSSPSGISTPSMSMSFFVILSLIASACSVSSLLDSLSFDVIHKKVAKFNPEFLLQQKE